MIKSLKPLRTNEMLLVTLIYEKHSILLIILYYSLNLTLRYTRQFTRLFRDYLTNRTQTTKVNNIVSSSKLMTHRVPQGSILGPLLFVMFVNDLPSCSKLLHLYCLLTILILFILVIASVILFLQLILN